MEQTLDMFISDPSYSAKHHCAHFPEANTEIKGSGEALSLCSPSTIFYASLSSHLVLVILYVIKNVLVSQSQIILKTYMWIHFTLTT